jgi:shikimate dehydrogenase
MADIPRAFVAGHPIKHSRSPLIHGYWLKKNGLAGSYEAIDVAPEDFPTFLKQVREGDWIGGNVTIPHKEGAYQRVDRRDEAAEAIGAVNTLWMENDALVGANTDAYGFAANCDAGLPGWRDGERALVLGAGGASRAVIQALKEAGYSRIDIANRTPERAITLARRFGAGVEGYPWDVANELLGSADLTVNTTSLGMEGQPPLILDFGRCTPGAMATDIVYAPLITPFLMASAEAGLKTCDGLGMLLHQAVPGFERWFGIRPEVDEALRARIVSDLERS